ncbi:phage tail sheath subtilisin-like domain-containing protein [Klebsiella pneumoniae]|nr:phage tail sheath subtilisin-like domain-containing protein [Klebsiella pneumoniae]
MSNMEQIPDNIRVPLAYIEINNHAGASGLTDASQNVLMLGYPAPTQTNVPITPQRIYSAGHAQQIYGRGSQLAEMAAAFIAANKTSPLYCQAAKITGMETYATGEIKFSGSALESGSVNLLINGVAITIPVSGNDGADVIAERLQDYLADQPACAVAVASGDGNAAEMTITLRSTIPGAAGNDSDIRLNYYPTEKLPDGVNVVITPLTGGAGVADMASVVGNMGGLWFSRIVNPFNEAAGLGILAAELLDRWGPLRMTDGIAFMAVRGNLGTASAFGLTRNDFLFSTMATGISPQPPYIWAAVNCAVATFALAIDPARPLQTLRLPGILPPAEADRWLMTERNSLLYDGISTFTVADSGVVQIERQITMYRTDSYGATDDSYLDVNTIATLSYIRYATRVRIQQRFPRHKLADDGTRFAPGQPVATPSVIRAELLALFTEFEYAGLVEGFEDYQNTLIVERDTKNRNRVNVYSDQDIVNQFRMYAQAINYIG